MNRRRFLLVSTATVALAATGIAAGVQRSFHNQIDREIDALLSSASAAPVGVVSEAQLDGLPEPVQRWMRSSGVIGTGIPSIVRIRQEGEFRLGDGKPWMPMHATQYYTTNPSGFLWNASMRMFPLVHVTGRDRYFEGTGDIEMRVASLIPVATASGGNLDSGALLRYLNETMWFPAALLLPNVTWNPVDDTSARATLTDAGQSVSAIFEFDDQNRLLTMTADRWNDSEQATLPWSTPLSDWGTLAGITMPIAGSGVWGAGTDTYDYIRLRITDVEYDPPDLQ